MGKEVNILDGYRLGDSHFEYLLKKKIEYRIAISEQGFEKFDDISQKENYASIDTSQIVNPCSYSIFISNKEKSFMVGVLS